jgi:drug/metabolite transporter (DMT)-like permease
MLLVAGSLGAAVPSVLFLVAIRLLGGTRTGILMLIEPVVAAVLAALVLDEGVGALQVVGGAAVLAGAAIVQRGHASSEHEAVSAETDRGPDEEPFVAPAPGGP